MEFDDYEENKSLDNNSNNKRKKRKSRSFKKPSFKRN